MSSLSKYFVPYPNTLVHIFYYCKYYIDVNHGISGVIKNISIYKDGEKKI